MSDARYELRTALGLAEKELVAFVGGGGKTTALQRLVRELRSTERSVLATTTTRMYHEQLGALGKVLIFSDFQSLIRELRRELAFTPAVPAALATGTAGKLAGLPKGWVDEIWRLNIVDYLLVEADGSRGRSLKAPAEHEPVIPRSTTLVVPVVGLDILGKPITPEYVHRPELVAGVGGVTSGSPVTIELVVRIVVHPSGLGKGIPPGARVVPLINKVGRPGDLPVARRLATGILSSTEKISRVVLAGLGEEPTGCMVVSRNF